MLVCKDTALLKSLLLDVTDVSCYNLSVTLHGLSVLLTTVVRNIAVVSYNKRFVS